MEVWSECSQSMLCQGCSNNPGSDYILTHGNLINGNLMSASWAIIHGITPQ